MRHVKRKEMKATSRKAEPNTKQEAKDLVYAFVAEKGFEPR